MITMGDDEFILHIRKNNFGQHRMNPELGRKIWDWIRKYDTTATITQRDQSCLWGDTGSFVDATVLPKTATQFQFNETLLPDLYRFLRTL